MLKSMLNRRQLFGRLTGLLVTVTGAGGMSCTRERKDVDPDTLKAMLQTFVPPDKDPGALQAGVFETIAERISRDQVTLQRYVRLLAQIDRHSEELYQAPFKRLPASQKDELLNALYHSTGIDMAQLRIDLHTALRHCFHAFYSSPAARQVIGYHPPIEGGYPDYAEEPGSLR